jgi:KaiC/GvpD/RAD55 family RecA-like ATPase
MHVYPDKEIISETSYNESKNMSDADNVVKLPESEGPHPYLTRKRIKQHDAIIDEGDLHIRIINNQGKVIGTQFIDESGKKKFNYGLEYKGCFHVVGGPIKEFAYLCEGFATAASVHEATGKPAVHCLNAANITDVAGALREVKPETRFVVAGDNDPAGLKACEKAFAEHGIECVLPDGEGLDWNDVWIARGAEATRKKLEPRNVLDDVIFPWNAKPQLDSTYIIKNWITENSISVVYGPSNVGKSFFCMSLAYHIAAGEEWINSKVKRGSVLYLATEGGRAFENRLYALHEAHGFNEVSLAVRPSPINLYDADEDIAKVEAIMAEIGKRMEPVTVLVIDTLARATAGQMDENNNSEMSKLIAGLDAIRERTGVHIMLVHHSGKDASKGARGASALRAACDTEIELSFDEETRVRTARATKQRDMETGAEINFVLQVVELGEDADGDQVTTCIIREATQEEMEAVHNDARPQGANQKLFRKCFVQLRGERVGSPNPAGAGFPEARKYWCINKDDIEAHFVGKVTTKNPQQTFTQTLAKLIEKGYCEMNEGKIWIAAKEGRVSDGEADAPF